MSNESHIYTIDELKQEIASIYDGRKEIYPTNDLFSGAVKNKECFEIVRTTAGDKVLMPVAFPYLFLYRGQNQEYAPCLPTLYRNDMDLMSLLIEKMRYHTFEQLLDTHPIVKDFFKAKGFRVDYEGLAQHYGLKTSVLDFTSDLNVALFFATCKYNPNTDSYMCYDGKKKHRAILYLINPFIHGDITKTEDITQIFERRISCIGMQPFARPGAQKGFAYHCTEEKKALRAVKYHIEFTTDESRKYFARYLSGRKLWVQDELVAKTNMIKQQMVFTRDVFEQSWQEVAKDEIAIDEAENKLKGLGISVVATTNFQIFFSSNEQSQIIDRWNKEEADSLISSLVQREEIVGGVRYSEIGMQGLVKMSMLELAATGLKFPHGGISIDYNK